MRRTPCSGPQSARLKNRREDQVRARGGGPHPLGDTVATSGFVGIGFAETIAIALEVRFLAQRQGERTAIGEPRGLNLVYNRRARATAGIAGSTLRPRGLVRRVVGGHWGLVPNLQALAVAGEIEAYNLRQGVITHLYRDIAAGKPGHLTRVGLDTLRRPAPRRGQAQRAFDGRSRQPDADRRRRESMIHPHVPIDIGIVRGTTADPTVICHHGAGGADARGALSIAMAVHNCGGRVIVQVERIAERGSLNPRQVKIPGILATRGGRRAGRGPHADVRRALTPPPLPVRCAVPMSTLKPLAMNERKIIAARGAGARGQRRGQSRHRHAGRRRGRRGRRARHRPHDHDGRARRHRRRAGLSASTSAPPPTRRRSSTSPISSTSTTAAGSTAPFLGLAQVDRHGNLNGSVALRGRGSREHGGFINISQQTQGRRVRRHVHGWARSRCEVRDGRARDRAGRGRRQVRRRGSTTRSGRLRHQRGQPVLYVTERCVLRLTPAGLELVEVAPGIDIDRDILAHMQLAPIVDDPQPMDASIFATGPMGLRERMLAMPLEQRFAYDPMLRMLFIDFRQLTIAGERDIARIRAEWSDASGRSGTRSTLSSTTETAASSRPCGELPAHGRGAGEAMLPGCHALRPVGGPRGVPEGPRRSSCAARQVGRRSALAAGSQLSSAARPRAPFSLKRWILPVWVLGSAATNSPSADTCRGRSSPSRGPAGA